MSQSSYEEYRESKAGTTIKFISLHVASLHVASLHGHSNTALTRYFYSVTTGNAVTL